MRFGVMQIIDYILSGGLVVTKKTFDIERQRKDGGHY